MLATAARGAIWSSCSPTSRPTHCSKDLDRSRPKCCSALMATPTAASGSRAWGFSRNSLSGLPSVEHVAMVGYLHPHPQLTGLAHAERFEELGGATTQLDFARVGFNDPLYILYSSGTTGAPKCIVHGVGGTLLQHQKEHLLHTDLKRSDRCSTLRPAAG